MTLDGVTVTDVILLQATEDQDLVAPLVVIYKGEVESDKFNGRIIEVAGVKFNVVGPPEEVEELIALLVSTDSKITTAKIILVEKKGTIVTAVAIYIDMNGELNVVEVVVNLSSQTIISTTTEAAIQLDGSDVTTQGIFTTTMMLAVVGAGGDPQTKITTANSFMEANNSKIEFFQPTHLTNALIKVNKGDFLTLNGGEMIFHKDFLRMDNAEIQVFDGFLINVQNGASLDIEGKLAVGVGGVNTIVVNNTAPVTGIQNGISFTSDPTATVQIGVNPLQNVDLKVTGSAINAGIDSSVKINTP